MNHKPNIVERWHGRLQDVVAEWALVKEEQLTLLNREDVDGFIATMPAEDWLTHCFQRLMTLGEKHNWDLPSGFKEHAITLTQLLDAVADGIEPFKSDLKNEITRAHVKRLIGRHQNKDSS